jgi:uncharacterized protein (TIGR03435 family)
MGGFGKSAGMDFETSGGLDEVLDGLKPLSLRSLRGVWVDGTADELCHTLESQLDKPVVNETNLKGEFRFRADSTKEKTNDFLDRLRDQLGLEISTSARDVDILTFASR